MTSRERNQQQGKHERKAGLTETPPQTVRGILRHLGPGLIIAGSIVGSGELIATTKTGAQAGFWLLWLIIIGCVIKVFAQVEFGRYAISAGKTAMAAMDEVPGPRLGVNWLLWYWLAMFVVGLAQLGGIVGGVGQSMAISLPISGDFNRLLDRQEDWDEEAKPLRAQLVGREARHLKSSRIEVRRAAQKRIGEQLVKQLGRARPEGRTLDDLSWATVITLITVVILFNGRYQLIQNVSMLLVAAFTLVTVLNLFVLQSQPEYAVRLGEVGDGLRFRLPPIVEGLTRSPLATALATFGIIGVGANELIAYPYWCLEKGYARFTGPRENTPQWAERARGWMRVMRWDACISMLVYTFATLVFYLLGAAVLWREKLDPEGNQMIQRLSEMYVPVFGDWAPLIFLFGAFAVLYSTFFVANAGHARVASDALRVFEAGARTERDRLWWVRAFCIIFPLFALAVYLFIPDPVTLILASGVMQAIMLPMLGGATLYFRYRRCDSRIAPGRLWDLMLWVSAFGLLVAGGWIALMKLFPSLEQLG